MAFEWDEIQIGWLRRRLARRARRFQDKIELAGSSLELDAAAEDVQPDDFFDFLTKFTVFENKAPSEVFDRQEAFLCASRTCLLARRWSLPMSALAETTQVVLCSRVTKRLVQELGGRELRPGVLEAFFVTRLIIVEANRLPLEDRTMEILILYATGRSLRRAVERVVDTDRREHYGVLWFLRRELFLEVLEMKGKTYEPETVDIRGAVEELGIVRVIDAVGLKRVVDEIGLKRVIDEIGLKQVINEIGLKQVVDEAGLDAVIEAIGPERAREALARLERPRDGAGDQVGS